MARARPKIDIYQPTAIDANFKPRRKMAGMRPIRLLAIACMLFFLLLVIRMIRTPHPLGFSDPSEATVTGFTHDPNLDETHEPPEPLHRVNGDNYDVDNPNSDRIAATILTLVRNSELDQIVQSMQDLEKTWNHKFNYPWTFINDEPFTEEFKKVTSSNTNAKCSYHEIPKEHWEIPSWINRDLMHESAALLKEQEVQFATMESYHQMCRWNSGFFYRHPALQEYRYYWRVEPNVHFFCDVDYDVFRYMHDHNKTYGFTITLYDSPLSVETLFPETVRFMAAHPEYIASNSAHKFIEDIERRPENNIKANGYSTCHFWSNFEIGDMDFWRSEAYEAYFEHLDRAGGFFYERWGDAPVHTVALGLFEDRSKIHWFKDIGYQHIPFFNCPNSRKCRGCTAGKLFDGEDFLSREDCRPLWFKYVGNEWAPTKAQT